jgi:methylaspartate mutase epsilon subunit
MGFGSVAEMRSGLEAVAALDCAAVGTITLDSYTRVGDYATPISMLEHAEDLNGYPVVSHPVSETRELLDAVQGPDFPVQLRHGTALPQRIFARLLEVGLDATEGGPVSYCLPYSRVPLVEAVRAWGEGCRILRDGTEHAHLESFGGCLLGQLCPPSLLVAIAVLETRFFRQHGVHSVSLSYAQGTNPAQDRGALRALRRLAGEHLGGQGWHIVVYTYMGVFPRTAAGARRLIADSARLARDAGAERLIVKTAVESMHIPSIEDNLDALRLAHLAGQPASTAATGMEGLFFEETYDEARSIVDAVLQIDADVGRAIVAAFAASVLDVPYCLHPDNPGRAKAVIDDRGALGWSCAGRLPLPAATRAARAEPASDELVRMLHFVASTYDADEH